MISFRREQMAWHRRVWLLALPIILSNVTVPLVGAVDTAVMGRLSEPEYIGAVALGASIFSLLFWVFGFLRMGTSGFIAQAFGADDQRQTELVLLRSLFIATVMTAAKDLMSSLHATIQCASGRLRPHLPTMCWSVH